MMEQKPQFYVLCQCEFPRLSLTEDLGGKNLGPDSKWQRTMAENMEGDKADLPSCNLQAEKKGKSLTSLPSSARQQPREVQALRFPQPISLSTPPPVEGNQTPL